MDGYQGMFPASSLFPDQYEALDFLCRGCRHERGWVDVEHARGPICPHMDEAQQYDGKPTVDVWYSDAGREVRCHYREEKPPRRPKGHKNARGQQAISL